MTELDVDLTALLPADLPDGREAVEEGKAMATGIERDRSLFCEEKGVGSEREWRERRASEGIACTCMNIGLATWADTREALGLDLRRRPLARGAAARPLQPDRRAAHGPAERQTRRGAAGDRAGDDDRAGLVGAGAHGADRAGGG